MDFNFGEKMKALRKKRDLTQEQLAEYLNVSFQAVSKWETNAAFPDISLVPIIANFYGITTDELLGVDITKTKEKVAWYYEETFKLYKRWKLIEMVELARKSCHEFPGNLNLNYNLAWALHEAQSLVSTGLDEAITICNKILSKSTDTQLRLKCTSLLCYCYQSKGDKESALKYAEELPHFSQTQQYLIGRRGLHKGDAQIEYSKDCIKLYFEMLKEVIVQLIDVGCENVQNPFSNIDKIEILKQILLMQNLIYGEALCDQHFDAYEYNRIIACFYLLLDDIENSLLYLETAYTHAEKFMQYQDGDSYNSLVLKNEKSEPHSRWSRSPFEDMLDRFTNQDRYDKIRNEERFINIHNKLNENK